MCSLSQSEHLLTHTIAEYNLGSDVRRAYLNNTSPTFIQGIDALIHQGTQVSVLADAGGEGTVIADSANAMLQGTKRDSIREHVRLY